MLQGKMSHQVEPEMPSRSVLTFTEAMEAEVEHDTRAADTGRYLGMSDLNRSATKASTRTSQTADL